MVLAAGEEELPNGLEGPRLAGLGAEMREPIGLDRQAQEVEEIRQAGVGVEAHLLQAGAHLGGERLRAIVRGDPAILPQQVQDRQIGLPLPYARQCPSA